MYTVHIDDALYPSNCTLRTQYMCNVDGALYPTNCTLHTVHLQCRWCTVPYQLYTLYAVHVQYMYNVDGALYSSNCTLCTRYMYNVDGALTLQLNTLSLFTVHIQCRWCTVLYLPTVHSVHSRMNSVYCTM